MLEEFKVSQPLAYNILKNALIQKKYAHAYIFEDNSSNIASSLATAFIKELLILDNEDDKDNIIAMIDSDNHPEVKRISSDSLWIKKDQIKTLQEEFSKKPIIGNKKVYIIEEAEKLNKSSSNTILKFLEEPEEGIIAILIVKNVYDLLETVKSRCQLIKIKNGVKNTQNLYSLVNTGENIPEEEFCVKIEAVLNFAHFYEQHHMETICFMQKLWHDYFNTKELCLIGFDLLILYYKDCLNHVIGRKMVYFDKDIANIEKIFANQDQTKISEKLEKITIFKEKIKSNANLNLLMDKLIIDLEGGI